MADIQTLFLVAIVYFVIVERLFEMIFALIEMQVDQFKDAGIRKKAIVYIAGLVVGVIIASGTDLSFLQVVGLTYSDGSFAQYLDFVGTGLFFAAGPTGWHQIVKLVEAYYKPLKDAME